MTRDEAVEVLLRALAGGVFVLAFAALAEMLTPKRLAGVFSAAPSVALASLIVTGGFTGPPGVLASARGMLVGAAGFTVYCLVAVPLLSRLGTWRGSVAALVVWCAVAAAGYALLPGAPLAARWKPAPGSPTLAALLPGPHAWAGTR